MSDDDTNRQIAEIMAEVSDPAKELLKNVMVIERQKIHIKSPKGIVSEIQEEVRRIIK